MIQYHSENVIKNMTDGKKPRVLHIVESWHPRVAGYTIRSWALLTAQATSDYANPFVLVSSRQHMYGHSEVTQLPNQPNHVALLEPSAREKMVRKGYGSYIDTAHLACEIDRLCATWSIDAIHCHWSSGMGRAAAAVAQKRKLPLIAEVRFDLTGAVFSETVGRSAALLEWPLRRYFEQYLRSADSIVAASYTLADLLSNTFSEQADRIHVVPNGVDCAAFYPQEKEPKLIGALELDGKFVIGSTSNMLRYEGLETLLDLLPSLQEQLPNCHLLLVGDGTQRAQLERRAQEEKLPVTFAGSVPKEDVVRYLNLIDLFVVPRLDLSITRYASPLKVIEAMACGCAIVGTGVGDIPMLLDDERGLLVAPHSTQKFAAAIVSLARDSAQRQRLSQNAQEWSREYLSWRETVDLYGDIYAHLFSPKTRASN